MSFILEALKRSENQRQRETGPGLATAPVGEEESRRPPWLAIAAALLILNLAVLAFMLYRPAAQTDPAPQDPGPSRNASAAVAPEPRPAPVARPAPTPIRPAPAASAPPAAAARPEPLVETAPPPRERGEVRSLRAEVTSNPAVAASGAGQPANSGSAAPPAAAARTAAPTPAPVRAPAPVQTPPPAARSNESVNSGLPTVQDVTLRGEFSGRPLHLDLHVYYDDPARRLVFINGSKYREGEELDDGLRVDEIVPEGVVLDDGRQRFLLPST